MNKINYFLLYLPIIINSNQKKIKMENPGVDPGASRMLSERSTI